MTFLDPFLKINRKQNSSLIKQFNIESLKVSEGNLVITTEDGRDFSYNVREIVSVNIMHDVDKNGHNGKLDVFVYIPDEKQHAPFGGLISKKDYVGRVSADGLLSDYIREDVRNVGIPVLEL